MGSENFMTVEEFTDYFVSLFDTEEEGWNAIAEGRQWVKETFYEVP